MHEPVFNLQVLIPGLEERARFLPRLSSVHQLTPGYLDAPATALAPLGHVMHIGKRGYPEVTLVFCALDKYGDMKAMRRDLARDVLEVYNDTVRRSLLAMGGYECQVCLLKPFECHVCLCWMRRGIAVLSH